MESISETRWDVVINGTGLQQSLLALALSRSGKNILHVDANSYYGDAEAALSLQEAEAWAGRHRAADSHALFAAAQVTKAEEGLSSPRSYSLALAPHVIHARSELVSQLVSSKAFRQLEFLAVGPFYIFRPASETAPVPTLGRVPSTREEIFVDKTIPSRAKRSLTKFIRFVLDYESDEKVALWRDRKDEKLSDFLESEFKLDAELRSYVSALALSLDGNVSVGVGLAAIHRHLTSMGVFGPGFAAVYPKWGGLSEVAQVGCRAAAVGGAIYMLATSISDVSRRASSEQDAGSAGLEISLSNGTTVRAARLVKNSSTSSSGDASVVTRLTAIVDSGLASIFGPTVDGAPTPCVAVIALPPRSIAGGDDFGNPVYAMVHSSDTGECPAGQCIIHLSTAAPAGPKSKTLLESALTSLLDATSSSSSSSSSTPTHKSPPKCLYRLFYEQRGGTGSFSSARNDDTGGGNGNGDGDGDGVGAFAALPLDLAFPDEVLASVREAWDFLGTGASANADTDADADAGANTDAIGVDGKGYMQFDDREGYGEDEFGFD